jgi:hypothetical protein
VAAPADPIAPESRDRAVTVSVVMVWLPAVLSVALNVPTPLVSVEFAGSTGRRCSKWTMP